jgi:replicative DNA helicase
LQQYIHKGFVLDSNRFKYGSRFSTRYFDDLLEEIRDIRSSERMLYQKITDIYATAIDYSSAAEMTKQFFATVQNKLHFAITGKTAAEIIAERADSSKLHMGLTTWRKSPIGKIYPSDILVAVFWSRIGTPTENFLFGTVEEIERFASKNKPVLPYFSTEGINPQKTDPDQLQKLQEYRSIIENKAIIFDFPSQDVFKEKLHKDFTNTIIKIRQFENVNENGIIKIIEGIPKNAPIRKGFTSKSLPDLLQPTFENFAEHLKNDNTNAEYFRSGFADLDLIFGGGYLKKSIYTIAGFSNSNKSLFLKNLVLNFVQIHFDCLVVSLQENDIEYTRRLLCMEANVDFNGAVRGRLSHKELPKFALAAGPLSLASVRIIANPSLTLDEIKNEVEYFECNDNKKPIMIIDDFFQLFINESLKNPNISYSTFASALKNISYDLDTVIIGAFPLMQPTKQGGDLRPQKSDFKDAYPLWQYSSGVLLLNSEEDINTNIDLIEVIVGKNILGPIGKIDFLFNKKTGKITENSTF